MCFSYELKPYFLVKRNKPLLNLVFVEINLPFQPLDIVDITLLAEKLEKTTPFNEFTDHIAIWQVKLSDEETATFFQYRPDFPYLSVRQDFLDSLVSKINEPFKLVIIGDAGFNCSAELSSPNQTSLIFLNKQQYPQDEIFSRSFLHEFGHSLGLRDEGEYSHKSEAGPPNCAQTKEDAVSWWGGLVGKEKGVNYFGGCCGSRNYIRPTVQSVMNDFKKSGDYGVVNVRYLREALEGYSKNRFISEGIEE